MPVALKSAPPQLPAINAPGTSPTPPASGGAQPADFFLLLARASAEPVAARPELPITLADPAAIEMPQLESDGELETDEPSDEDDALLMASFLPSLAAPVKPAPDAAVAKSPVEISAAAITTTQGEPAEAAEALLEATDEATLDVDSPNAPATQAAHAAQAHSGITHQMAASSDAAQMARELRNPVGTPAWNDELGGQLTWMAANGRESASLRLSPENLGPLEVRINVQDGEAKVWFNAASSETRSALEQSLPRLRELFASQGLVLADAGVHREAPRQSSGATAFTDPAAVAETDATSNVNAVTIAHSGLIDTYA